jgi:hypothetical protein
VRDAPWSVKEQAYAAHGIASRHPGQHEVDHLVNLSIGGSNDVSDLRPDAASPIPGFHEKDRAEVYLQDQLCSGKRDVRAAQTQIATNWLQIYNQIRYH